MQFPKLLLLISAFLIAYSICPASNATTFPLDEITIADSINNDTIIEYHALNLMIRDCKIDKQSAQNQLNKVLKNSRQTFFTQYTGNSENKNWVFPLTGHDFKSIGGKNGNGFIVSQFDYFDFSKPGGHPAQDIFIKDKNQDCKDDITLQPVGVLSVSAGIVLDTEPCWTPDSIWKGGKYIHIYDPVSASIFYYAHNDTILVCDGDIVKPGDLIAYVGRTGLNAYAKRSQTHLHFAQFKIDETGYPRPVNPYKELLKAKSIYLSSH